MTCNSQRIIVIIETNYNLSREKLRCAYTTQCLIISYLVVGRMLSDVSVMVVNTAFHSFSFQSRKFHCFANCIYLHCNYKYHEISYS